ncbi:peptide deformylase [Falsihalocynthiibacter sp. S25ZX9]|uniref:Peptide deformylase-like n=1 Tax=Falsihalocynthiibacter arcticus TaxID=1579316 RepID=A0A126UYV8_9RHOB|nr:peptide deformylase [Falsihalocynthiibacter arcticus]AML51243.1 peptide deformylase [Falsihalocynthiibacter arcticus]
MSVRPFVAWPDKRLRTVAQPVAEITDATRAIWADMVETMEAMPGLGLAAVQIGVLQRLAVVDCSQERGQVVLLANPEVLHASGKMRDHEEASPNLPGVSATITRPRAVTVRFLNSEGLEQERDFVGVWATSVQHQIDHLNGRMYFDHLSKMKRDMLLRKAKKLQG